MPFVSGTSDTELDFDMLVKRLCEAFPETTVISEDYYADRLRLEKAIARQLGMADDCAPIRCTERVAREHGTQRHLSIPISSDTKLDTRIDKMGILAVGGQDTEQCRTDIGKLVDILTSFLLKIQTSWGNVK
ncbi:hypothetical protein Mal15_48200 [Stieleria maiorica]|uniref:Uncharacterized protein n=1 Tax=Stieleria maiorica TaxID=2795974 RepID=A0A5B9MPE3_9BACT|nr:hypothetical protein [Stieleria maiorica]QEG00748.1 hypothetical protein Mal15_48200 [Stieleria maiorica]